MNITLMTLFKHNLPLLLSMINISKNEGRFFYEKAEKSNSSCTGNECSSYDDSNSGISGSTDSGTGRTK